MPNTTERYDCRWELNSAEDGKSERALSRTEAIEHLRNILQRLERAETGVSFAGTFTDFEGSPYALTITIPEL